MEERTLQKNYFDNLKYDLPAGIAVFFIAIPLCLGIAHASGAPLFAGLISGIIGGIVAGFISGSHLSVSGPAAGLTAVAIAGIAKLGSFEAFLAATFLAGLIQLAFSLMRMGKIVTLIPGTVIRGMLSAIGLILIIKQMPHLIGYDIEEMGVQEFSITSQDLNEQYLEGKNVEQNTFTVIVHSLSHIHKGVFAIGLLSLIFLFAWNKYFQKRFNLIPASLLVVLVGVATGEILDYFFPFFPLLRNHFVNISPVNSIDGFISLSFFPSWNSFGDYNLYVIAFTVAVVASIETLLSIEAMDKLDPWQRRTPKDRELMAQGISNALSGLLGGLPITAVIVRGSVNIAAGARSKVSTISHGIFIGIAVIFLSGVLNHIPLASLSAVLIYTGYKLLNPAQIIEQYKKGWAQLVPFLVTVIAITTTDLLIGVIIGVIVSLIFIVREDYKGTIMRISDMGRRKRIILGENITFLHKPKMVKLLEELPEGSILEIDGSKNFYIDKDILEVIEDFKLTAKKRNIEMILGGINNMENKNEELKDQMQSSYEKLFMNNRKWVKDKLKLNPEYFRELSDGQTPQYLFIGCSDSRVPANEITGTEPGEMFVQRNIANLVVNTDINLMSVLQYSIEVLNVKHVIVCGHYGCGGVKAAMAEESLGLIDKWLRNIKDVYRLHRHEIDSIEGEEERHRKMVELNVREQVFNLMKTSYVQKNRMLYGFPQVHGWVYNLEDGLLIDLKIDVEKDFPEYKIVYKLY